MDAGRRFVEEIEMEINKDKRVGKGIERGLGWNKDVGEKQGVERRVGIRGWLGQRAGIYECFDSALRPLPAHENAFHRSPTGYVHGDRKISTSCCSETSLSAG